MSHYQLQVISLTYFPSNLFLIVFPVVHAETASPTAQSVAVDDVCYLHMNSDGEAGHAEHLTECSTCRTHCGGVELLHSKEMSTLACHSQTRIKHKQKAHKDFSTVHNDQTKSKLCDKT